MQVDALGGAGRARIVASKIRDLQAHALELAVMREVNGQTMSDPVPGLLDKERPVTYEQELRRVDNAVAALVDLFPDDAEQLQRACEALAEQPDC